MKVVLFCGGLGMRLRERSENVPKPMINIGYRPIIWHVMRYYAYYGHNEFILCLGYQADFIKDYFLNYKETVSNDFVLSDGGRSIELLNTDIKDWKIKFVDTGLNSNIGQRLRAVKKHLEGEEAFLANYTDGLSDLPLPDEIAYFREHNRIGCFVSVKPTQTFHLVSLGEGGVVTNIQHVAETGMGINGGFFIFKKEIFNYLKDGEELVQEPFHRLIAERQLIAYPYNGFWACMDTFKDRQLLEDMYAKSDTPWEVWKALPAQLELRT